MAPSISMCSDQLCHTSSTVHPLDPLTEDEISLAATCIRQCVKGQPFKFNCITLREPRKTQYTAYRAGTGPRPPRCAFSIVLMAGPTIQVSEVVVNLGSKQVESWKDVPDVLPILTPDDQDPVEEVARCDPQVIEACQELGITDMSKVYFDAWCVGFDYRWGIDRRLQQAFAYYRASPNDNQYAHPLDFVVIVDTEPLAVVKVEIRRVNGERTPVPTAPCNYHPEFLEKFYRPERLKPIHVTQPQGVSFHMEGNELRWAGIQMHVGFNYREGIVLSDIRIDDPYERRERMLFNRISVAEMIVPYGHPTAPHQRKQAFDVGEYGMGLMTNSLRLGCDCKGVIEYRDATFSTAQGGTEVVKNAICIHEEDNGLLYKKTDSRDNRFVSARDRKLVISQIVTAANYDYGFYHTFTLDGTYKLEVKLTGILNTYVLHTSEEAAPYGTEVAHGVDAHNHQHIFSLRVDPALDGTNNTVVQNDAMATTDPVGSAENPHGNAFVCQKTPLRHAQQAASDYSSLTGRTWDIINPNRMNPVSKKPVGYKIVNNNCPPLLPKPGGTVYRRAGFARKSLWVVPYRDDELYPAGDYVCQSWGEGDKHPDNSTILDWVARDESVENTDIVCFIQFGVTHFPRTEDFPVMPVEPVSVSLRACNFFQQNPGLWVPASTEKSCNNGCLE
ncbi:hypothetical protein FE257_005742 [Aspergillus nanangensis]|uniref:Amine oxidase n=1 Tax=Aspergillus nanangensis TaxID=2582783 RepID=A0AAD4CQ46_ASPNN|nr:hypothetical protein FE257_005742 [Aspergillus nanangensis]